MAIFLRSTVKRDMGPFINSQQRATSLHPNVHAVGWGGGGGGRHIFRASFVHKLRPPPNHPSKRPLSLLKK